MSLPDYFQKAAISEAQRQTERKAERDDHDLRELIAQLEVRIAMLESKVRS